MDANAAFADGIQELSFDEVTFVAGGSQERGASTAQGAIGGAAIGAALGAAAKGAKTGAKLGTVGGVKGAAIGAVIGGLVGFIAHELADGD